MSDDSKPLSVPESSLSSAGKESATHSPQPVAGTAVQFPWLKHLLHDLQRQCCGRSVHIDPRNGPQIRKELEALLKQATANEIENLNRPFYSELWKEFEEALGPHPVIQNGQYIERARQLRIERDAMLRDKALLDQLQKLYGSLVPGGDYREHIAKIAYNL